MAGPSQTFWNGKKVFLTGHTGFKGVWLSLWLQSLGATVFGYSSASRARTESAEPPVSLESFQGDICDLAALQSAIRIAQPEVVLHLAAQPLVRRAMEDPIATYRSNVIGTATLLESLRHCDSVGAAVVVTTDRCYETQNSNWAYRESDPLAGNDPYSSSKACMEMVAAAFRDSFFRPRGSVGIATARAGNMIGGGDWAQARLVPDTLRSFAAGKTVTLRNPLAARPWQYVLETLRGYLLLAEHLYRDPLRYSGAWNFGPGDEDVRSVEWIVQRLAAAWGAEANWNVDPTSLPQESQMVRLDCSKTAAELDWKAVLPLAQALDTTVSWYRAFYAGADMRKQYRDQLAQYAAALDSALHPLPQTTHTRYTQPHAGHALRRHDRPQ